MPATTAAGARAPPCSLSTIPRMTTATPAVTSSAPGASRRRAARSSRLSGTAQRVAAAAARASGALTKSTQRQLRAAVSTPPSSAPAGMPSDPAADQRASARSRSPGAGKLAASSASAHVPSAPPRRPAGRVPRRAPTHCRGHPSHQRAERERPETGEQHPPAAVDVSESTAEHSKPPKHSRYALITHCRSAGAIPRSSCIAGKATATISPSATTRKSAAHSAASRTAGDRCVTAIMGFRR